MHSFTRQNGINSKLVPILGLALCFVILPSRHGGAQGGGEVGQPASPLTQAVGEREVTGPSTLPSVSVGTTPTQNHSVPDVDQVELPQDIAPQDQPSSLGLSDSRVPKTSVPGAGSTADQSDVFLRGELGACPVGKLRAAWSELGSLEHSAIESEVLRLCTERSEAIARVLSAASEIRKTLGNLSPTPPAVAGAATGDGVAAQTSTNTNVSRSLPSLRDDSGAVGQSVSGGKPGDALPVDDKEGWEVIYTVRAGGHAANRAAKSAAKRADKSTDNDGAKKNASEWIAGLRRVSRVDDIIEEVVGGIGNDNGVAGDVAPVAQKVSQPKPRVTRLVRRGDRLGDVRILSIGSEGVEVSGKDKSWFIDWATSDASLEEAGGADWIVESTARQ